MKKLIRAIYVVTLVLLVPMTVFASEENSDFTYFMHKVDQCSETCQTLQEMINQKVNAEDVADLVSAYVDAGNDLITAQQSLNECLTIDLFAEENAAEERECVIETFAELREMYSSAADKYEKETENAAVDGIITDYEMEGIIDAGGPVREIVNGLIEVHKRSKREAFSFV